MSDVAAPVAPVAVEAKAKKVAAAKPKVAKDAAAAHSTYKDMVKKAIVEMKEKTGSSKAAIFKYLMSNFKLENEKKVNAHLRTALKSGLTSGLLKQTSGTGASGSFKIADMAAPAAKSVKPKVVKKAASPKKTKASPKKTVAKKAATAEKKAIATKKVAFEKKNEVAALPAKEKKVPAAKKVVKKAAAPAAEKAAAPAEKAPVAKKESPKKAAPVKKTIAKKTAPAKPKAAKKTVKKAKVITAAKE